jgi:hypothetical protein
VEAGYVIVHGIAWRCEMQGIEEIKLTVKHNSQAYCLTAQDAKGKWQSSHLRMLGPICQFGWRIGEVSGSAYLNRSLDRTARQFTEAMLCSGCNWLTIYSFCDRLDIEAMPRGRFIKQASRFNGLIYPAHLYTPCERKSRLVTEVSAQDSDDIRYRIKPELAVCYIISMNEDSAVPTGAFDWVAFWDWLNEPT